MYEIYVTDTFKKLYLELPVSVRRKADKKTELFRQNPFHPSLRTKKLEPHQEEVWSFWVDKNYRIKFRFPEARKIHLLFIGDRKDIYR